jgi:hypothetical protein
MTQVVDKSYNSVGPYPSDTVEIPRSGHLFEYTRFENVYRCPEFERAITSEQRVFNYTRSVWARKYRPATAEVEARISLGPYEVGDQAGPIMKPSGIFAPSALPMMEDEEGDRHIAGGWMNGNDESWIVCDPVFDALDQLGQYHGAKVASPHTAPSLNPPIKRGSLVFYDGHVSLRRDPFPSPNEGSRPVELWHIDEYFAMFEELAYALYGTTVDALLE